MDQNPDPFSLQFGPMTPTGPVTSQLEWAAAPPLPPRPPHLEEAVPPLPPRPSCLKRKPVPHNAPRAAPSPSTGSPTQVPQFEQLGGSSPPTYNSSSLNPRSNNTPIIPPALPARADPSLGCPEPARQHHSLFGSTFRKLAEAAFPAMINPNQPAPCPAIQGNGQVVVNGVAVEQADLLALQAVVGPVLPGSYWYDRKSGAYGTVGGPCAGFLVANLPLGGGPLAPDASGHTGTGVFINGREIHSMDVVGLQNMGAVVMPGRWWVDAVGSYGAEGSPIVLGNLRMQAASAGNSAGGAGSWSTHMGNYGGSDGQGFTYVGGPGWSWSSG